MLDNKPFRAPSSNPKKILDIGCGTGVTTVRLAQLYPSARVIGVDMSPVPVERLWKDIPSNVEFITGDIKHLIAAGEEPFKQESFDYVFQRFLLLGMTDWPFYIPSLATILAPGGWLECQDPSMTLHNTQGEAIGQKFSLHSEFLKDAGAVGLDVQIGEHLEGLFAKTGLLQDVRRTGFRKSPVARAEYPERSALEGQLRAIFKLLYGRVFQRGRDEAFLEGVQRRLDEMLDQELEEGDYFPYSVVTGKKKWA